MSRHYYPDNWVVIKIKTEENGIIYKILAGWSGGYAQSDSWQLNSGIVKVEEDDRSYSFYGSSGSCYVCGKESYGLRRNNAYIWHQLEEIHGDKVELMPEDTDWLSMDWKK
jgi:hypothetical protein